MKSRVLIGNGEGKNFYSNKILGSWTQDDFETNAAINNMMVTSKGRIFASRYDKLISYSDNNGESWSDVSIPAISSSVLVIKELKSGRLLLGSGYSNSPLFYSDDDGLTWNSQEIDGGIVQAIHSIHEEEDGRLILGVSYEEDFTSYGGIYYSDEFTTWHRANCDLNGSPPRGQVSSINRTLGGGFQSVLFMTLMSELNNKDRILRSEDNGINWTSLLVNSNMRGAYDSVVLKDGTIIIAGSNSSNNPVTFFSTNGLESFTEEQITTIGTRAERIIEMESGIILVTTGGYGASEGKLFKADSLTSYSEIDEVVINSGSVKGLVEKVTGISGGDKLYVGGYFRSRTLETDDLIKVNEDPFYNVAKRINAMCMAPKSDFLYVSEMNGSEQRIKKINKKTYEEVTVSNSNFPSFQIYDMFIRGESIYFLYKGEIKKLNLDTLDIESTLDIGSSETNGEGSGADDTHIYCLINSLTTSDTEVVKISIPELEVVGRHIVSDNILSLKRGLVVDNEFVYVSTRGDVSGDTVKKYTKELEYVLGNTSNELYIEALFENGDYLYTCREYGDRVQKINKETMQIDLEVFDVVEFFSATFSDDYIYVAGEQVPDTDLYKVVKLDINTLEVADESIGHPYVSNAGGGAIFGLVLDKTEKGDDEMASYGDGRDIQVIIDRVPQIKTRGLLDGILLATDEEVITGSKVLDGTTPDAFDELFLATSPKLARAYRVMKTQVDEQQRPIVVDNVHIIGNTVVATLQTEITAYAESPSTDFYAIVPVFYSLVFADYLAILTSQRLMIAGISTEQDEDVTPNGNDRVIGRWTEQAYEDVEQSEVIMAGEFGNMLGRAIAVTWKFKNLKGMTPDVLTNPQLEALELKGWNAYKLLKGRGETSGGTTTDGLNNIQEVVVRDNVGNLVANAIHDLFITTPKIPLDDRGRALVDGSINKALLNAVGLDLIAQDDNGVGLFNVSVGKVTAEMRDLKTLKDVSFRYVPSYGAEFIEVAGEEILEWINN